jgi:hypothetical protein
MTHALTYTVPKRTGTYADTLEAIGVASLLEELHYSTVTIRDSGTGFSILAADGPNPASWPPVTPGFPFVWKDDATGNAPPSLPQVLDYLAAKAQNERWKKFNDSQKKSRSAQAAIEAGIEVPERPTQTYFTASTIESMRKGWNGDRELALWIGENPAAALSWVRAELDGGHLSVPTPTVSNSQLFNPIGGKGVHKPKTSLSAPSSLPDSLIRPFAEWMKFRGLWRGMLLYRSGDDFKFFVLEPSEISSRELDVIHSQLQKSSIWGGCQTRYLGHFRMPAHTPSPIGSNAVGRCFNFWAPSSRYTCRTPPRLL